MFNHPTPYLDRLSHSYPKTDLPETGSQRDGGVPLSPHAPLTTCFSEQTPLLPPLFFPEQGISKGRRVKFALVRLCLCQSPHPPAFRHTPMPMLMSMSTYTPLCTFLELLWQVSFCSQNPSYGTLNHRLQDSRPTEYGFEGVVVRKGQVKVGRNTNIYTSTRIISFLLPMFKAPTPHTRRCLTGGAPSSKSGCHPPGACRLIHVLGATVEIQGRITPRWPSTQLPLPDPGPPKYLYHSLMGG